MDVILKPFIKMMLFFAVILGIANLLGIDVEEAMSGLKEKIDELTSQAAAEQPAGE